MEWMEKVRLATTSTCGHSYLFTAARSTHFALNPRQGFTASLRLFPVGHGYTIRPLRKRHRTSSWDSSANT